MKRFLAQGLVSAVRTVPVVTLLALLADHRASMETSRGEQLAFPSPEQAVDALLSALRQGQTDTIAQILGPNVRPLILGNEIAATKARQQLVAAFDTAHKIERQGDDCAVLVTGAHDWSFSLAIVKRGSAWRFDNRGVDDIALPQSQRVSQDVA